LALFLLLVIAASLAGSSADAGEWYYVTMQRPSIAPPGWLYAVAGALVSVLMAFAGWKIWLTQHFTRLSALTWWVLLVILNLGWQVLFFGWHRPGWALPLIGLAAGIAIFCIKAFRPLSREAAWLMAPYLAWIAFLAAFNISVWMINGGLANRFIS
jgi:tryptophan-rich sensory protein